MKAARQPAARQPAQSAVARVGQSKGTNAWRPWMAKDEYAPKAKDEPPAPVKPPAPVQPPVQAPLSGFLTWYDNPSVAELQRKKQEAARRDRLQARKPRVGQRVWLTSERVRVDFGEILYMHREDDMGIVVSSLGGSSVDVLFRNSYYRHVRNRAVEPTYKNRRARIPISSLRLTDPKPRSIVTGRDPLLIELAALRTAHPGLIAKQLHELVSITPAPSLSVVKKALSRLAKEGRESRSLKSIPIEIDILLEIAAALPISDLLALTATCSELRNSLEDVRLTRTKGLIVKYHEKMRRDSGVKDWN